MTAGVYPSAREQNNPNSYEQIFMNISGNRKGDKESILFFPDSAGSLTSDLQKPEE